MTDSKRENGAKLDFDAKDLDPYLLKDPEAVIKYHTTGGGRANRPVEIAPRVSEVERILKQGGAASRPLEPPRSRRE